MSDHTFDDPKQKRGFRLIELLVVIAIIAILVALLRRPENIGDWPNNYSVDSKHVGGAWFTMGYGSAWLISEHIDSGGFQGCEPLVLKPLRHLIF